MKLSISEQALSNLNRFVDFFEEAYFKLYSNTGIQDEAIIASLYYDYAQRLKTNILEEIKNRLSPKKVLTRKEFSDFHELIFHVDQRLIVVWYFDDPESKSRVVHSISIDRKPILF